MRLWQGAAFANGTVKASCPSAVTRSPSTSRHGDKALERSLAAFGQGGVLSLRFGLLQLPTVDGGRVARQRHLNGLD